MIELANLILFEEKKAINFKEVFEKIVKIKEISEEEKQDYIAQFYTDLNVDGRFIMIGSNMWGLKRWYPVEQIDEDITVEKKTKKKRKKSDDEDLVVEEDDELSDELLSLDDIEDIDEDDYDDFDDDDDEVFDEIEDEELDFEDDEDEK